MDKRQVRKLDRIGLDQIKNIGLEQEYHTKQIRVDKRKNRREESLLLRKCPEGRQEMRRQGEGIF